MVSALGSEPQGGGFKPHWRRKALMGKNGEGEWMEEGVNQIGRVAMVEIWHITEKNYFFPFYGHCL